MQVPRNGVPVRPGDKPCCNGILHHSIALSGQVTQDRIARLKRRKGDTRRKAFACPHTADDVRKEPPKRAWSGFDGQAVQPLARGLQFMRCNPTQDGVAVTKTLNQCRTGKANLCCKV